MDELYFEDIIIGKEYSFYNIYRPDSIITGIGSVIGFSESPIQGPQIILNSVKYIYELDWNYKIDSSYTVSLVRDEYCFCLTEKQRMKDLFLEKHTQIPSEVADLIFQMIEFRDLEKLKKIVYFLQGIIIDYSSEWRNLLTLN